jgi:hypothetical protein
MYDVPDLALTIDHPNKSELLRPRREVFDIGNFRNQSDGSFTFE